MEAAVHHVYQRHLAEAVGRIEGLGAAVRRTGIGFLLGSATGLATAGLTGPLGIAAGSALGIVVPAVQDARALLSARRRKGWVAVHQQLNPPRQP